MSDKPTIHFVLGIKYLIKLAIEMMNTVERLVADKADILVSRW